MGIISRPTFKGSIPLDLHGLPQLNVVKYLIGLEEYVGVRHQLRLFLPKLHSVADDAPALAALAQLRHVGVAGEYAVLGLP